MSDININGPSTKGPAVDVVEPPMRLFVKLGIILCLLILFRRYLEGASSCCHLPDTTTDRPLAPRLSSSPAPPRRGPIRLYRPPHLYSPRSRALPVSYAQRPDPPEALLQLQEL